MLDTHTSIIEGSIGAIPRRLMVAERRSRAAPQLLLAEAGETRRDRGAAIPAVSEDALLGGRVRLRQPVAGYRVAIDPVLLAAAVPAAAGETRARYRLRRRRRGALPRRARRRAAASPASSASASWCGSPTTTSLLNGLAGRVVGDGRRSAAAAAAARARHLRPRHGQPALPRARRARRRRPIPARPRRRSKARPISRAWVRFALAMVRAKGTRHLHPPRRPARRICWRSSPAGPARSWSFRCGPAAASRRSASSCARARACATPTRLLPGLVLHEADGRYTAAAEAVLRDGARAGAR